MERASMPEEFKIDERGRVVGYNQMFGYVPIQPQEVLEALEYKAEHNPDAIKKSVSAAVAEALRSTAEELKQNYVVLARNKQTEIDADTEAGSKQNIDDVMIKVVQSKHLEADDDLPNIVETLSKVNATEIKLDTLDTSKSYILTVTFNSFKDVDYARASLQRISESYRTKYPNLSIIIQVNSQGITYNISEDKKC